MIDLQVEGLNDLFLPRFFKIFLLNLMSLKSMVKSNNYGKE